MWKITGEVIALLPYVHEHEIAAPTITIYYYCASLDRVVSELVLKIHSGHVFPSALSICASGGIFHFFPSLHWCTNIGGGSNCDSGIKRVAATDHLIVGDSTRKRRHPLDFCLHR